MNVVLGNRATWKDESGYYNKISNLAIEANNLANYGYINGYQDTLSGVNVTGALIGGIIFGMDKIGIQYRQAMHMRAV
jgi:hypothetical protein